VEQLVQADSEEHAEQFNGQDMQVFPDVNVPFGHAAIHVELK
jgi:hypothetical protein